LSYDLGNYLSNQFYCGTIFRFIAVKCALHGKIYIFNMNSITSGLRNVLAASDNSPLKLKPALTLNWSQTDNYFMSISYNPRKYCSFN
jgi:hypothetical protein